MEASFDIKIVSGVATYTLTGSAESQKVLDTAEDAARYVYPARWQLYNEVGGEQVPIPFDDLTAAQKKAIIAREFVYYLKECARAYHAITATDAARNVAIAEAEDKYGLE